MVDTYTRRRVVIDKLDTEVRDGVMAVRFRPHKATKKFKTHYISVKDFKAFWKKHPKWNVVSVILGVRPVYYYYGGPTWDFLLTALASGTEDMFRVIRQAVDQDAIKKLYKKGFDKNKLMHFESSSHTFYPLNSTMPWSRPYHFDYISGVCNDTFDLDKVEKILKKFHPAVFNVKRIEIPYYNASDSHSHAVEFSLQLPQKDHDRLVRYWRDKLKVDNWEGRLIDGLVKWWAWKAIKTSGGKIKHRGAPDLLGLKKALRKDAEQ